MSIDNIKLNEKFAITASLFSSILIWIQLSTTTIGISNEKIFEEINVVKTHGLMQVCSAYSIRNNTLRYLCEYHPQGTSLWVMSNIFALWKGLNIVCLTYAFLTWQGLTDFLDRFRFHKANVLSTKAKVYASMGLYLSSAFALCLSAIVAFFTMTVIGSPSWGLLFVFFAIGLQVTAYKWVYWIAKRRHDDDTI